YSTIPIFSKDSDSDSIDAFRYVAGKQRKKLRSKKKLIDTECTFEIRRKKDGSAYPGREVEQLVGHMISEGIRVKEYFSDEMLAFWERLYDSDVLCVALLYKGGEIVTCNFMYYDERHREYIKWLMLYRENSWNMAINIKIAEYIYKNDEGATINFARGIYDYKLVNFHPDVKALFCVKIAKTKFGHIKNMLSLAVHYSKPVIKSLLGR
ncbi:MAG: hypothetical protein K2O12_06655, partial [Muribaculaceae bacterium]|nr:hypothetical protein [Muribaculaceae bacterium]